MKLLLFITLILTTVIISANSLKDEESPYLQQHSNNPVEWFAWGDEAFKRAKDENKLIFLSIGYSTCHWCHVMERESFEDKEIADILNKHFISIKVDREEYPQIDKYYQLVYQLLNRRGGGWPLTIVMTPDKEPFFADTYIPKESPSKDGLKSILNFLVQEWSTNPSRVKSMAHKIKLYADEVKYRSMKLSPKKPDENISKYFVKRLKASFDKESGGWGDEVKFPQASRLLGLIDIYRLTKDKDALDMLTKTLDTMAQSGFYDQVEGGFFRYSTDKNWQIPHFEKMLYSNAELIEAYSKAWQITKKPLYKRVVQESIDTFIKRYRDKSGLFYGASDADSLNPKNKKEEEGFYFTYDYNEVKSFLEAKSIDKNIITRGMKHYGFTKGGNFINFRNNPYIADEKGSFPIIKKALREIRETKEYPFIDKKMQSSWNGLMIHSLFVASKIDNSYSKIAKVTLDKLLEKLYINDTLYHQILPNKKPKVVGNLEDYAFVIEAILDAYDSTMDMKYLNLAQKLQKRAKSLFFDKSSGIWLDSQDEISNPLGIEDGAYRSALATTIINYLRIASILEDLEYANLAKSMLYNYFSQIKLYVEDTSTALRASLAYIYGYILIKAKSKNLKPLKVKLENTILYPFFEYRVDENSTHFQACKIDRCTVYERDMNDFLQKLKKSLE